MKEHLQTTDGEWIQFKMCFNSLQQIVDLDEKNQILTSNIWLSLYWQDDGLVWNTTEYGGIHVKPEP